MSSDHRNAKPPGRAAAAWRVDTLPNHLRVRCSLLSPEVARYFTTLPELSRTLSALDLYVHVLIALDRLHVALLMRGLVRRLGLPHELAEARLARRVLAPPDIWHTIEGIYECQLPSHFPDYCECVTRITEKVRSGMPVTETEIRGTLNLVLNYVEEIHQHLAPLSARAVHTRDGRTQLGAALLDVTTSERTFAKLGL